MVPPYTTVICSINYLCFVTLPWLNISCVFIVLFHNCFLLEIRCVWRAKFQKQSWPQRWQVVSSISLQMILSRYSCYPFKINHFRTFFDEGIRSSWVVRAFDSQCRSRNCPGFYTSILRHSRIWGVADEAVLNIVHKKIKKIPLFNIFR